MVVSRNRDQKRSTKSKRIFGQYVHPLQGPPVEPAEQLREVGRPCWDAKGRSLTFVQYLIPGFREPRYS